MKRFSMFFCLCGALLSLQGCLMVGPDYLRPDVATPVAFKEAPKGWKIAEPADGADRGYWWRVFKDPMLDKLVPLVAIDNQNLKSYEAAYRQALAVVREDQSSLFPSLSASGSSTRARSSGSIATTQTAEATVSWEIDLWGKTRRQIESAEASAGASAAQLADLTLSAQATLVTDYFSLRYQDSLARLLNDTARAYERSLKITQNQYAAGVAALSDVITAQTQLETTRASAIGAEVSRAQYEHAIALLIGKPPSDLSIPRGELPRAVPTSPAALPSSLLERRPDIAEAERKMQQQNALIGVAIAAYFPTIDLAAVAGYSGVPPLISASNAAWSLAASGSLLLIDGGAREATVDAARAAYEQSVANYRQTVLAAFQAVEDQLSDLRLLARQASAQSEAVRVSQHAVEITLNQYKAGASAYTAVVTAQATALSNEETALQIRQRRLTASANLMMALGGGWRPAPSER
ncbi:RND transporter (plasmid) [Methylosinus sp. C49]|uniref:efflux transporter outer membrane subunit n=1 Tax=Methylosinus sp. C49 TaxID=2699395 RepID=UPI0013673C12|nr:efflux transporter outer membrane subunit [Methylosinus sp. C49]BBU63806.1 RND transporter [Methylosinus sp. C49]